MLLIALVLLFYCAGCEENIEINPLAYDTTVFSDNNFDDLDTGESSDSDPEKAGTEEIKNNTDDHLEKYYFMTYEQATSSVFVFNDDQWIVSFKN